MANRAYLYAQKGEELLGIAEYNYDIPIAFKIFGSISTGAKSANTLLSTDLKLSTSIFPNPIAEVIPFKRLIEIRKVSINFVSLFALAKTSEKLE